MGTRKKKQLSFMGIKGWGGRRHGAGRPNKTETVNHMERPAVEMKTPLHITMRLQEGLTGLRSKKMFKEFGRSIKRARRLGLYTIHFSIMENHIHLIVETGSKKKLGAGMRSLAGSFARAVRRDDRLRRKMNRKKSAFHGRYHLHVLRTPKEAKNALKYVLLNASKHGLIPHFIDDFSSGSAFDHWNKLVMRRLASEIRSELNEYNWALSRAELNDLLTGPRSWLMRSGWERAV